jgi:signal transduction histidine kinase
MGLLTAQLRRGSLVKAAAISSFVVVAGLVALVKTAAWLLPSKIHLTLPPFFITFILLSILAFFFTFPVMWTVRMFYRDDIAELEHRVAERTAQLRAANRELEAFSYSVSHDLRAPLRHIDGFSKILAGSLGSDETTEVKLSLDKIGEAAKQMGALIDDLLKMAQIGRQEVVRKTVDVRALLQAVIDDLQMEYQGRQVRWLVGELPKLACD